MNRLVFVRTQTVYPVPPVCTTFWTAEDWQRTARRVVESLVLDGPGGVWVATGQRNERGEMLYELGPRQPQ